MRAIAGLLGLLLGCGSQAPASPPSSAIRWEEPIELATGGGERGPWQQNESRFDHVDDPSIVLDASGAAVVAWVDHRDKDVRVQTYERSGAMRFAQPVNVSRTPEVFSWLPRVAVSPVHPRDVIVVWQEIIFSGGSHGGDILVARSLDGGATFESPQNLSQSRGGDGKGRITAKIWNNGSLDLAISADGTVHVVWTEYDGQLWFTQSHDRGRRFAAPRLLADDRARPARAPALAVGGEIVHLAWTTGEDERADIHLATSLDRGASFGAPEIVARTEGYSDAPKLAIDRHAVLHLAYAESDAGFFGRFAIHYTRSRDGGRSFEAARVVSRPQPSRSESAAYPALAVDGDRVHVSWELYPDHRDVPRGLALATSSDGGATFSTPERVPASADPDGGGNGSFQGRLMRKLAARDGAVAVVNSSLALRRGSRVWMIRGYQRSATP